MNLINRKACTAARYCKLLLVTKLSLLSVPAFADEVDPIEFDQLKVQNCSTGKANGTYTRYSDTDGELVTFQEKPVYKWVKQGVTYSIYYRDDTTEWVLDKNDMDTSAAGTVSKATTFGATSPGEANWSNRCRVFPKQIRVSMPSQPGVEGVYSISGANQGLPKYVKSGGGLVYYHKRGKQWVVDANALHNKNFKGVKSRGNKNAKNILRTSWTNDVVVEPAAHEHYRRLQDAEDDVPWTLSAASWNIQNYGQSKGQVDGLVDHYASIITQYDIVFIQEIKEPSPPNTYLNTLCARVQAANPSYVCRAPGTKAGQPGSYEQSVLFYHSAPRGNALVVTGYGEPGTAGFTRQPLHATFSYTVDGDIFTFTAYNHHTSLGNVNGELNNLEGNVVGATADALVIGDLNADCNYFSQAQEATRFVGWDWWITRGQKTNVRGAANCAYDRIITRGDATAKHQSHHIKTAGISYNPPIPFDNDRNNPAAGQSLKRISDHFLVAIQFGGVKKRKKRQLEIKVDVGGGVKRARREFDLDDAATDITMTDVGLAEGVSATLHVVEAHADNFFMGNAQIDLNSISWHSEIFTVGPGGELPTIALPSFDRMTPGVYRLVLDVNNDGIYDINDGDIANLTHEADFIVLEDRSGVDDVFTLDDRGVRREVYDISIANNVYALASNLSGNTENLADIYIVSQQKLEEAGIDDWTSTISNLNSYAIPINGNTKQTVDVSDENSFFYSVWSSPSDLYTRAPNNLADFSAVDEYGKNFNVVVDVNRNGNFNPASDKVDTHFVDDVEAWADSQQSLPEANQQSLRSLASNYPSAVREYKAFLNAKLGTQLDATSSSYDAETELASMDYLCAPDLPPAMFDVLEEGAKVGFQVLGHEEYYENKHFDTGIYRYADVELKDSVALSDNITCIIAEKSLRVIGFKNEQNSTSYLSSNGGVTVHGDVESCKPIQVVAGLAEIGFALFLEYEAGAMLIASATSAAPASGLLMAEGVTIGQDGAARISAGHCF